jgi:hypothetical protein
VSSATSLELTPVWCLVGGLQGQGYGYGLNTSDAESRKRMNRICIAAQMHCTRCVGRVRAWAWGCAGRRDRACRRGVGSAGGSVLCVLPWRRWATAAEVRGRTGLCQYTAPQTVMIAARAAPCTTPSASSTVLHRLHRGGACGARRLAATCANHRPWDRHQRHSSPHEVGCSGTCTPLPAQAGQPAAGGTVM